ncbi:hypothetical protein ACGFZ3_12365 [Stenotrophomonas sp. NPDC047960]|uniref:hypothetical protein n=1 Tax=Stenotrophomonas sp. NPDC047960 TaxID=3364531 RepID=UPI003715FEB9
MQSSKNGWRRALSGTAMMFCVAACTAQTPTLPQAPKGTTRAMATVVKDATWSEWQAENNSEFQCDPGKVLVGRERVWEADENKGTRHLCATVVSGGEATTTEVVPWSDLLPEQDHRYSCDEDQHQNKVMVGRKHDGDEESDKPGEGTKYRCAALFDHFGDELFISSGPSQKIDDEYYHGRFVCGANQVMTYRSHFGDERKPTYYKCATVW